jgi:hypothetical protein
MWLRGVFKCLDTGPEVQAKYEMCRMALSIFVFELGTNLRSMNKNIKLFSKTQNGDVGVGSIALYKACPSMSDTSHCTRERSVCHQAHYILNPLP